MTTLDHDPGDGLSAVDFVRIGPLVGERFPDVSLPAQDGRVVSLHEHRAGRRGLVVISRSADW